MTSLCRTAGADGVESAPVRDAAAAGLGDDVHAAECLPPPRRFPAFPAAGPQTVEPL